MKDETGENVFDTKEGVVISNKLDEDLDVCRIVFLRTLSIEKPVNQTNFIYNCIIN